MKRLFTAALLFSGLLPAAAISVNPVAMVKAIHDKASPSTRFRRVGEAILLGGNLVDWRTTLVATQNYHLCETNGVFTTSTCILNKPKFNWVKGAVTGFVLVQEVKPLWRRHEEGWNRTFTIIDFSLGVPMLIVGVNNWRIIEKHR